MKQNVPSRGEVCSLLEFGLLTLKINFWTLITCLYVVFKEQRWVFRVLINARRGTLRKLWNTSAMKRLNKSKVFNLVTCYCNEKGKQARPFAYDRTNHIKYFPREVLGRVVSNIRWVMTRWWINLWQKCPENHGGTQENHSNALCH